MILKLVWLVAFFSFSVFSATDLYRCKDTKSDDVSYLKLKKSFFVSDSIHWSLNNDSFDVSDKFYFSDIKINKEGYNCVSEYVDVFLFKSRTVLCFDDAILDGKKNGEVLYYYASGGAATGEINWARLNEYDCSKE